MKENDFFDKAFDVVMKWEGGYSNHPNDLGGETIYGITRKYHRSVYDKVINLLKRGADPTPVVKNFYFKEYWEPYSKFLSNQYAPVIFEFFDMAINTGHRRSVRLVQIACNVFDQRCSVDGTMGEQTAAACRLAYTRYGVSFVNFINLMQGLHYLNLAMTRDGQITFLKGWMKRLNNPLL